MSALKFHKTLYEGLAVDAAMKRFARFANFETDDDARYWVVRVRAHRPEQQLRVERELANFALGLTIERGGPPMPAPSA